MTLDTLVNKSLIPRLRNTLTERAICNSRTTQLIFLDADIGFDPEYIQVHLQEVVDVIGDGHPKTSLPIDYVLNTINNGESDDILKADAHYTKVISTALLSNGGKRSNGDGRSQQPQGETTQHGALIRCRKYALLVLLLSAALGRFSFAAMQQAIKNPTRGGALN